MKGLQISKYVLSPQDLVVTSLPSLQSHPLKYLVKIYACGINFSDLLQVRGKYQHQPPLPWIAGVEFAGVVEAVPTGGKPGTRTASVFQVGDSVFGAAQGSYATHVLAEEQNMHHVPPGWDFTDAAGAYLTFPTAYSALVTRASTQANEWVLVHAGAGSVGLSAIQIAKALGATVIATAGSERKREICRQFGADYVIDYRSEDWPQQVVALCKSLRSGNGQAGVDVVYDPVGMIDPSLKCIGWNGRLLVIGFSSGNIEKIQLSRVLLKNVSIVGLHWGMYYTKEIETIEGIWRGVFGMIAEGRLRSIAYQDTKYKGLEDVPRALMALEARNTWGKVVVELAEVSKL